MMEDNLYSTNEILNKSNNELKSRMEAVEKLCSACNVVCTQVDGKWGVGLKVDDSFMLIDPLDLVSSIYKSECCLYLKGDDNIGTFIV